MAVKKIIQIIPADGWSAVYRHGYRLESCRIPCWALLEEDGDQYVMAMDTGVGEEWLDVIDNVSNFVGFTHESNKKALELQFPQTEK